MVSVSTLRAAMDRLTAAARRIESQPPAPWSEGATVVTAGAIPSVALESDAAATPRPVKANWGGPLSVGQRVRVEHAGTKLTITHAPRNEGPFELILLNSWVASGTGWGEPQVSRHGKTVHLTGLATAPGSPFVDIAVLPSWAYPRRSLRTTAVASTNQAVGMVSIASTGTITLTSSLWSATPTGYINLTASWEAAD